MSASAAQILRRSKPKDERVAWFSAIPILAIHLGCLGALWTGVDWKDDAIIIAALYCGRMFYVTGTYHRYFSHQTYKATRAYQCVAALLAATAAQKGPSWWAGWHRWHHRWSDTPNDVHSTKKYSKPGSSKVTWRGLWWSHMGWILSRKYKATPEKLVQRLRNYPEIRLIDRFYYVPPILLALVLWYLRGWTGLFVDFCWSTVLLYHGTFTINSFAHMIGRRERETHPKDSSGNSWLLAFITLGEGWHNDHHHQAKTTKQGIGWWKFDPTYYALWFMQGIGFWWPRRQDRSWRWKFIHLCIWDVTRHEHSAPANA